MSVVFLDSSIQRRAIARNAILAATVTEVIARGRRAAKRLINVILPCIASNCSRRAEHQEIGRFDAQSDDAGQQPNICVRRALRRVLQVLQASLLNFLDLLTQNGQSGKVASDFRECVRGDQVSSGVRSASTSSGALRSSGLKPRMPSSRQSRLHAIDDTRAFTGQAFPLAARPFGILLLDRRDRDH